MKPTIKKILWAVVIVVVVFSAIQTIQLFFVRGTLWKTRSVLEEELFSDKRTSYEPRLKAEIKQTEAYKKFKQTTVMDSLHIYIQQAVEEGRANLKRKDSIPQ